MESFDESWPLVHEYCKKKINNKDYKTWIEDINLVSLDFIEGKVIISVPSDFHKEMLEQCYLVLLSDAFEEVYGPGIEIKIITKNIINNDLNINKKDKKDKKEQDSSCEFTFSSFIVGPSNKFAHAASVAVATNPAASYNPLFLYGNSGLGKTHLLYAISNHMRQNFPEIISLYIKGDDFTNELIDSIKRNRMSDFHEKYRNVHALLVDDIQFIAGKDSTQEEFFHTFNTLYESKKQIVLTSDRPPREIKTLESRLKTRFEWGLIADIQPPDYETRIAIIRRKAELLKIEIPETIAEYIASKLKINIRQLEGAVKKMKAYHSLQNETLSLNTAKTAIADVLYDEQPSLPTVEKIVEEVADAFKVSSEDICSNKRSSEVSKARQAVFYICKEVTKLPMAAIGKKIGNRDHSTVIYALNQTKKNMKKNNNLKLIIEDIIRNIKVN